MDHSQVVGGLFEIGIGVPDLRAAVQFWQNFGYREGPKGQLPESKCAELYGVRTGLKSIRLLHQESDHGLLRLMQWDEPTGDGLNMASLRTVGNRWGVHRTEDMIALLNHAEVLEEQGGPINRVGPILNAHIRGYSSESPVAFHEPLICLRELQLMQPLYQLVVAQRYQLATPLYGSINPSSLFRCSQVCHGAIVTQLDGTDAFSIYDEVLGLKRLAEFDIQHQPGSIATIMFDLEPGDGLTMIDFDDRRSKAPLDEQRSGRLRVFNLKSSKREPDRRPDSDPGNLGYSLFTYRVSDLEVMRGKLIAGGASQVTEVQLNEFGERSVSFRAPDGYFWTLVTDDAVM